jgi:hypothetical protein
VSAPEGERLSDGARITEFVKAGFDVVAELRRLKATLRDVEIALDCGDVNQAIKLILQT